MAVPSVFRLENDGCSLRKCLVCGHVGCCDSSPGQHANQHFKETGHPVMQAHESGDLEMVLRTRGVCVRGRYSLGTQTSSALLLEPTAAA